MSLQTSAFQRKRWRENSLEIADEDLSGKFNWSTIKKFFPYAARYKGWTLSSVVLMLLYTALNLANPFLIGLAIDQFITHNDLAGLALLSIVLIVVNVLMWQAQYWQVWTMSWAGQQILYHLSSDMFAHLQRLSLSFYDKTQVGRVMSRLQSDIDVLEMMLSSGLLAETCTAFVSRHTRRDLAGERDAAGEYLRHARDPEPGPREPQSQRVR